MRIKELQWEQDHSGDWTAYGFFGAFTVEEIDGWWEGSLNDSNDYDGFESSDFPTAEEAKAYCQQMFENQVRGALAFVDLSGMKVPKDVANFIGKPIAMDLNGRWCWYNHIPVCVGGYWNDFSHENIFSHPLPDGLIEYHEDYSHSLTLPDEWEKKQCG